MQMVRPLHLVLSVVLFLRGSCALVWSDVEELMEERGGRLQVRLERSEAEGYGLVPTCK